MKVNFQNGNYYTYQSGFVKPQVRGSFFRAEWTARGKMKILWLLESKFSESDISEYLGWVYLEARDDFEFAGRFPRLLVEVKES